MDGWDLRREREKFEDGSYFEKKTAQAYIKGTIKKFIS